MGGGNGSVASEVRSGRHREQRRGGNQRRHGRGRAARGEKMKLTAGAHLTERREGGGQLRRRERKGKTYFCKYATDARASWVDKDGFVPREERGQRGRLG
jgi:hypothetical protein